MRGTQKRLKERLKEYCDRFAQHRKRGGNGGRTGRCVLRFELHFDKSTPA